MDNDERIQKWRQERGTRVDRPNATVPTDDPADAATEAPDKRGASAHTGERTDAAQRLPDDLALEDARLAIIERRRVRWRLILRRVALFVAIPALTLLLYVNLIATKLYQGEAVFTVQTSQSAAPSPTAGLFAMGGGNSTIADAFKAREFILSRPMMQHMEESQGLLRHFESSEMDPLTRFRGPLGNNGDPFRYYQKRVRVAVDVQEGIMRLYVQARTQQDAVRFGRALLVAAEAHVNAFSEKISDDQITALSRDVQEAERQVSDSRRSLAAVQARRGDLSPEQTATSIYQLISNLELQLAEASRERNVLLDQGLTNSPLLPRLTGRVQELRSQISEQRGRLVSPGGVSVQRTLNEFEGASARKEIAQARWESTLQTLQQAYLRILEQRRYFVIIVGMSVATFPKVRDLLTIAWPILLFLSILYVLIFAFRRAAADGGRSGGSRFSEVVQQWRQR